MPKVPSSCSHSMCIGGVCAECGARMGQEKARKKGKVKNVVPLSCSHPMRIGSLCTHCGAKVTTVDIENDDKSHIHATTSKVRRKSQKRPSYMIALHNRDGTYF